MRLVILLSKFPKSFARSLLYLVINDSSEKFESCPNFISLIKKNLTESSSSSSIKSKGFITLPTDLLIFESLLSHQPWAKIVFGRSKPIDISIVGQ